ncbi:MAG: phosphoadenylyl-sulfate reductase [Anaerolineae bacterium]|nr:phosphoadenylyl-sulfate reductase [Anaerolineae bacterium]
MVTKITYFPVFNPAHVAAQEGTGTLLTYNDLRDLNNQFEKANPQMILEWVGETYGRRAAVVTSLQPTGIVTLHMMQTIGMDIPVLTLDTDVLFPETYELIEQVEKVFDITIERIKPEKALYTEYQDKPILWETDREICCQLRKVQPLNNALAPYDAWIAGLRRDQSPTRANTDIVSWDMKRNMAKICPLATWTEEMVWDYIKANKLPYNKLHDQGYPSIGCMPCTQPANGSKDLRAGRWVGMDKTECGIHLQK